LDRLQIEKDCFVALDAASFASSDQIDLQALNGAHFVVLSFYKIYGYPTGLGCLLIRKNVLGMLQKSYFGGGTIEAFLADESWQKLRRGVAAFEDGTLNFQAIYSLKHGIQIMKDMNLERDHLFTLARRLVEGLRGLKYKNGSAIVEVYGWPSNATFSSQGPILAFNIHDKSGKVIGYSKFPRFCEAFQPTVLPRHSFPRPHQASIYPIFLYDIFPCIIYY
jgi:molybdenum cofactor sulfurtransferase